MPTQKVIKEQIARFVRRGRAPEPIHVSQIPQGTRQAHAEMCAAQWSRSPAVAAVFPPHNVQRVGTPLDSYDAYKYNADWNGSAYAYRFYAGCVCYAVKIPKDAWENTGNIAEIAAVKFNVAADRWIGAGCRAYADLSENEEPAISPDTLEAVASTLHQTGAILVQDPPHNDNVPQNLDVAIQFPPSTSAPKYLHVYLVLEDYLANREAWVEGSATLDYSSFALEYSRTVAADPAEEPGEPGEPPSGEASKLPIFHGVYAFQMPAMTSVLTEVSANHANRRLDALLSFTMGVVSSRTEINLAVNPTSGTSGVRFGAIQNTAEAMGAVAYGFSGVAPKKRVTGIMLPYAIPKPAWFAFRLVAYFLGMPDAPASGLGRDCITTLTSAELADPKLWAGTKTAANFMAPTNTNLGTKSRPMACALNRVFLDPVTGSAGSPAPILGIDYMPADPFIQLILLLSPAYPTSPSPSVDGTVAWAAADINNAKILQEP